MGYHFCRISAQLILLLCLLAQKKYPPAVERLVFSLFCKMLQKTTLIYSGHIVLQKINEYTVIE